MWLFKKDKSRDSIGNAPPTTSSETRPETPPEFVPRNLDEELSRVSVSGKDAAARGTTPAAEAGSPLQGFEEGSDTALKFDHDNSVISNSSPTDPTLQKESDSFWNDSTVEKHDGNSTTHMDLGGALGEGHAHLQGCRDGFVGDVGTGDGVDALDAVEDVHDAMGNNAGNITDDATNASTDTSGVSQWESGVDGCQGPSLAVDVVDAPAATTTTTTHAQIHAIQEQQRLEPLPPLLAFPDLDPGKQQEIHEIPAPSTTDAPDPESKFPVAIVDAENIPPEVPVLSRSSHRLSTQTNPELSTAPRPIVESPDNPIDKEESSPKSRRLQNRTRSHTLATVRERRSATESFVLTSKKPKKGSPVQVRGRHRTTSSDYQSGKVEEALAAVEPAHERIPVKMGFAEQQKWITVQQKTFTKWMNTKIIARGKVVEDLVKDLSDGVMLIHLLECLSNESLGRYAAKPKLRVQRFENANLSLDFIKSRGIQMTNIGAEDVVDGNRKIILGLIWTLILRFTISDINEEGMTAKEGLLLWCQRKTACYDEIEVRDFSASWNDGLAFCALLDIHRPDLIDYDALDKNDHKGNMQMAFDIASKEIGIPALLDVEDVCDVAKPDERSLMTYIAYWFHAFSQMEKVENAGRRVEKFVNNMQGAWEMQNAFEQRMRELLKVIGEQGQKWRDSTFEGTYVDAKKQATEFSAYKRGKKREWVAEKSDLAALLGNIKTKLSTYRLKPYDPPPELRLSVMEEAWASLMRSEMSRGQLINETIRDIKNGLRKSFADKANDFAMALNTMQLAISGLEGDVEDQLVHVRRLNENLPPLDAYLEKISEVDQQCEEANIEENDFTTYTYDELCYELGLVKNSVSKKLAFLDNQVVAQKMTNLTPIQLEEFESVFRHFDRDASNSLQELEFSAALASLGLVFSEDEMHDYFIETSNGKDYVTFEQFIRFMVDVTEDQNTAEQVFQSFREVADGKPYVTEMDLRHSLVPDEVIDQLKEFMPLHKGPDVKEDRGMPQYDYISFMDHMISHPDDGKVLGEITNGSTNDGEASSE